MNTDHTPTQPWHVTAGTRHEAEFTIYDKDGNFIPQNDKQHADMAAFVQLACNSHDKLVSALQFASKYACMQMEKGKPLPSQLVGAINSALASVNASRL